MVYRILLALHHQPEEYTVRASIYGEEGRLLEEKVFSGVKRVSIVAGKVSISAQLAPDPIVLIVEAEKPSISLSGEGVLVVGEQS